MLELYILLVLTVLNAYLSARVALRCRVDDSIVILSLAVGVLDGTLVIQVLGDSTAALAAMVAPLAALIAHGLRC